MTRLFSKVTRGLCILALLLIIFMVAITSNGRVANVAASVNLPDDFEQTVLISGLVFPTKMTFSRDGRIFVSEKGGRLRVFDTGGQEHGTFLDLTGAVIESGSRGLMGVAFDPGLADNGNVYTYYTWADTGFNRVSRFTASGSNPNLADPSSELVPLEIRAYPPGPL